MHRWHPFSVLMELIREEIVWDSSLRFSARTLIRMMTRIMQIVSANGLPTTGERQEFGIILLLQVIRLIGERSRQG
ncbi:MAG: hypothetical protein FJ117_15765 [Deltaproteobacteria bacterium]|nr:hypothetical protein [Deltaproteobacteria bacterium]